MNVSIGRWMHFSDVYVYIYVLWIYIYIYVGYHQKMSFWLCERGNTTPTSNGLSSRCFLNLTSWCFFFQILYKAIFLVPSGKLTFFELENHHLVRWFTIKNDDFFTCSYLKLPEGKYGYKKNSHFLNSVCTRDVHVL